jgi:phosphatidylglycerol:prolipoprotein diacylglycerol transferase
MQQVLFTIPIHGDTKISIYGFGTMLVLAFLASTWLAWWRSKREGLDPDVIPDMAFWIFLLGLVGARLFYCIEYWGTEIHNVLEAFQYWKGGIVYYGSVVGGTLGFFAYRWFRPFPLRPFMDVMAPAIAIGSVFGRLGCFLNGCCFGDPCRLPWAVSFPAHSPVWIQQVWQGLIPRDAVHSLPVHPTQLYSAIDALLILLVLSAYYPLRRRHGEVLGLLILTYPISRFLIEYLRNDEGAFFAGLTISQTISVLVFLGSLVYWVWLLRLPRDFASDGNPARPVSGRVDRLAAART